MQSKEREESLSSLLPLCLSSGSLSLSLADKLYASFLPSWPRARASGRGRSEGERAKGARGRKYAKEKYYRCDCYPSVMPGVSRARLFYSRPFVISLSLSTSLHRLYHYCSIFALSLFLLLFSLVLMLIFGRRVPVSEYMKFIALEFRESRFAQDNIAVHEILCKGSTRYSTFERPFENLYFKIII